MGFMDWLEKSVEKDKLKAWDRLKDQYDSEEEWRTTRDYYLAHPEEFEKDGKVGAHKGLGRSGPKQALVDLLSTDDLDALLYDCAPGLTNQANTSYQLNQETVMRLKELRDKMATTEKYQEIKGRYDELQKHYQELKEERDQLIKALQNNSNKGLER